MFHNAFWAWDGVLDAEFCEYILSKSDWNSSALAEISLNGGTVAPKERITEIVWHENSSPIAAVIYHHMTMANEMAKWNFNMKYLQRVQIGKYRDGGHYDWHVDTTIPDERGFQRKLSCSVLLNDASEYEGGQLELEGVTDSLPTKKGSVIVFPSILRHRVTPVTSGERYSAVSWSLGEAFK